MATIAADEIELLKVLDRLGPKGRLRVCYEAGPTGYRLARRLNEQGICCVVVAPSLVPTQKNRRIKTDRRDAVKLAHFLRSGDLVEVTVPEAQTEAMRDLERAREDASQVERVARQQLDKFLLRHGRRWSQGCKWTLKHWSWIKVQEFPQEAARRVLSDYVHAVEQATARVERLTADIGELVEQWTLGPLVRALQALRGVDLVTAVVLAAEIGDFQRFPTPKQLMAYLGLVPSEHSSGGLGGREESLAPAIAMHGGSWWKPPGTIALIHAPPSGSKRAGGWWPRACRRSRNERSNVCTAASVG